MIYALHIKNIAVIDEVNIEFKDNFNVLTGETGAGKSIVIDSINMVLGQRTSRELIRHGENKAVVEAAFYISDEIADKISEEYGIDCDDGNLILYRDINTEGKSVSRINGMMATAATVKEIAKLIINIHGQHDNQQLLSPSKHISFLDKFCGTEKELKAYKDVYEKVRSIKEELEKLSGNEKEKAMRLDLLNFQMNEIEKANLKEDEEEQLKERKNFLGSISRITDTINNARDTLYNGNDYSKSVHDSLAEVVSDFESVKEYDSTLEEFYSELFDISENLYDIIHRIRDYADTLTYDEKELDETEERLDLIRSLERKYGSTIPEILDYYNEICAEVQTINGSEERITELEKELKVADSELEKAAEVLTKKRKVGASDLEQKIQSELCDLDMSKVKFKVNMEQGEYTSKGRDDVEFLIATNSGDELKPLVKIASGGEMSRIMLAIKSVLSDTDSVPTMIFDEIDTGVSGRASQKIAEKISKIAKNRQILCITHLPQIAAMGDAHFLIEKTSDDNATRTTVTLLESKARMEELARIISGAQVTELTVKSAEEMLSLAQSLKEKL